MLNMPLWHCKPAAMFVVGKVVEEDRRLLLTSNLESITLPDGTT